MEKSYPIKYALLPIYEQKGYMVELGNLEPNYEVCAYVVSKCFVTDERTINFNGQTSKIYNVVFPFKNEASLNREMNTPTSYNYCSTDIVHEVFEGYYEAKAECDLRNRMITELLMTQEGLAADEMEIIFFQRTDKMCKLQAFEDELSEATRDLQIGNGSYQKTIE